MKTLKTNPTNHFTMHLLFLFNSGAIKMTTTALALRQQLNPDIWQTITAVAPVMKDSKLFGIATTEQAAAIV